MKDILLDGTCQSFVKRGYGWRLSETLEEYVSQKLRLRLSMFLGEWYLDATLGIPYTQNVLEKKPNWAVIEAAFKRTIKETPGVSEILEWAMYHDKSTRTFSVFFRVRMTDGNALVMEV